MNTKTRAAVVLMMSTICLPHVTRADLTPAQLLKGYGFNTAQAKYTGAGQTIAIYTSTYYAALQSDVDSFSTTYMNGVSTTVTATTTSGTAPTLSSTASGELALDVEYAHLIAPAATIMVVDGSSISGSALYAAQHGASVFSTSYANYESSQTMTSISTADARYQQVSNLNVVALGAAGDSSHVDFPASSPYVVGVAGSNPTITSGGTYQGESAWSNSGGGLSTVEPEPAYQLHAQSSGFRSTPDVAIAGGDTSAVPVIVGGSTTGEYGSSMATPIWAGLIALADQDRAAHGQPTLGTVPLLTGLYNAQSNGQYATIFHDIQSGSDPTSGLTAGLGYDELTGLGSPQVPAMIDYLETLPVPEPSPAMLGLAMSTLVMMRRKPRRGEDA